MKRLKKESKLNSAAIFLDEPNPLVIGENFLNSYLRDPSILDETIKVLQRGDDQLQEVMQLWTGLN